MMKTIFSLILGTVVILTLPYGCQSRERNNIKSENKSEIQVPTPEKIRKATFFIENSESMFGYVRGSTEYIKVLTKLARKSDFILSDTYLDFNFINGREINITPIGNNADFLTSKLNTQGFDCGDKLNSNLNGMFEVALENAGHDSISILISDGVYDVGEYAAPLSALENEGQALKTKFLERLKEENLQTLFVQFTSDF